MYIPIYSVEHSANKQLQLQLPLSLAVRTFLYTKVVVMYSRVDVIGHMGPVKLLCHVVVHSTLTMVTGLKKIMAKVNELGASGVRYNLL